MLDIDIQHLKDDFRGDLRLAVLLIEADLFAAQVFVTLDIFACQNMEFRIVELCDVLNPLFKISVQLWIAFLQKLKIILVNYAHIDAPEKQDIVQILEAAYPENRQDPNTVWAQIINDVPNVLGKTSAGTGKTRYYYTDSNVIGLPPLLLVRDLLPLRLRLAGQT